MRRRFSEVFYLVLDILSPPVYSERFYIACAIFNNLCKYQFACESSLPTKPNMITIDY